MRHFQTEGSKAVLDMSYIQTVSVYSILFSFGMTMGTEAGVVAHGQL